MKKIILTGIVLTLMLCLLHSCAGVSQEDCGRISSDLAEAQAQIESLQTQVESLQTQIQSLQSDKEFVDEKCAEALAYAEYMDIVIYPAWKQAGITTRFEFEDKAEWLLELGHRASEMQDTKLSIYVEELEKGNEVRQTDIWNHCLDRIEGTLK
ncbi:MAG TPA: hypothetical protein G4O12_06760 [Dehalococcoidia bacterium]|nr:hypothetical protein [Dehalococcoidia bacterium]